MTHTLEQYFNLHQGKAIDFSLRAEQRDGGWLFYIHPQNVDGETWDFKVSGNQLTNIVPGEESTEEIEVLPPLQTFKYEVATILIENDITPPSS